MVICGRKSEPRKQKNRRSQFRPGRVLCPHDENLAELLNPPFLPEVCELCMPSNVPVVPKTDTETITSFFVFIAP
jgi:hypothetical protein